MRSFSRAVAAALLLALVPLATGCFGSATREEARKLRRRCGLELGRPVGEQGARCIAQIYGVEDRKECPLVSEPTVHGGREAFRVTESCRGLGVLVAKDSGRILAVVRDGEQLHP